VVSATALVERDTPTDAAADLSAAGDLAAYAQEALSGYLSHWGTFESALARVGVAYRRSKRKGLAGQQQPAEAQEGTPPDKDADKQGRDRIDSFFGSESESEGLADEDALGSAKERAAAEPGAVEGGTDALWLQVSESYWRMTGRDLPVMMGAQAT
jgi:hypothetical protein